MPHIIFLFLFLAFMSLGAWTISTVLLYGNSRKKLLVLLLEGKANKEIADGLSISPRTVENHLSSVYQKTTVNSRVQLINLIRANAST